jgi:hypothetical protein
MKNELNKTKYLEKGKVQIMTPDGRVNEERSDCTVCALANTTGIDYSDARRIAWMAGRKNGKGFSTVTLIAYASTNHKMNFSEVKFTELFSKPTMSVKRFIRKFPKGNFLVRVRGHAFSIKDGIVFDSFTPKALKRITHAWQFTGTNS